MDDVPEPGLPESPAAPSAPEPTAPPTEAPMPGGDVDIPAPPSEG